MVNPTLAKRQTVGTLVKEPEYDPEYPQETLLCEYPQETLLCELRSPQKSVALQFSLW